MEYMNTAWRPGAGDVECGGGSALARHADIDSTMCYAQDVHQQNYYLSV